MENFWRILAFYSTITSKLPPKNIEETDYNTQEVILKHILSKFFTILALWRHLTPSNEYFEHFGQFLQISAFYSTITWKSLHKTMMKIVCNSVKSENFETIFPKVFHHFGPLWHHFDPQNQHFLSIFDNFCRFQPFNRLYNMEIIHIKPWWRLFIIGRWFFCNSFSPNLSPFWSYEVILTPPNHHFWVFWTIFCRFHPFTQL